MYFKQKYLDKKNIGPIPKG